MSVPLDRLYNYIENVATQVHGNVLISRFWPHGSKKIENLRYLRNVDWYTEMTTPLIVCHDQEPLNYELYEESFKPSHPFSKLLIKYNCYRPQNLKHFNIFDKDILLHSELNSHEVAKYASTCFIPVYYWSHAVIALDWFRFAQHVEQKKTVNQTFLIYNRAWSGTREYRAKFVELLSNNRLIDHCHSRFNCVDPDTNLHYDEYVFHNPNWQPVRDLTNVFSPNTFDSTSSADFELSDYESTEIEVVLETLFDDSRLHATEKMLRPIACGQPFILCSTAGSLNYLKNYGFQTYQTVWDESYDLVTDPVQRLQAVIDLMKTIAGWDAKTRQTKLAQARAIAEHNKKHFFSMNFFNQVQNELETNLQQGLAQLCSTNTSSIYIGRRKEIAQHQEIKQIITGNTEMFLRSDVARMLSQARKYYNAHMTH
jgi:hypothetical protein